MQNPQEDTEWNDILRQKGIIPPKKEKEVTEDQIVDILEQAVAEKTGNVAQNMDKLTLDELDELEDDEDEAIILAYRQKRIAEIKESVQKSRYGDVTEIRAEDYVQQVNKAGEGIWVVLHLYKQGIPLCSLVNQHLNQLAAKFPTTKFLRAISTTCIPNYPDMNLPTIFVYFEGDLKKQYIGPIELRGMKLSVDELEWMLKVAGAVPSTIEKDPKPKVKDVLMSQLRGGRDDSDDDDY
ncbi:viral IAP-associated factor homolog [Neocloeon triangulifer]|uniref:viral IAP-associated factor homolog n=1 Tax=Neocloeon triangulifer TaxID=2078957 RepID=UPI00286EC845|nr:viral IAP-associated factor homolog [Neocloeon triangulifer]XP_059473230.1 viral IAP-associated factor homolog [Neocloeon triangulifer]